MQVLNGFKQLLYDKRDLVLREVHLIQIMEELSASDTLHCDINPLTGLEVLVHRHDVGMRNHTDDQQLISQELLLLLIQLDFVDLLDSADFARDAVPRVVDVGELASANPANLLVDLGRRVEAAVLAQVAHPRFQHVLVAMVHSPRLEPVALGIEQQAKLIILVVNLLEVEATKVYNVYREFKEEKIRVGDFIMR